jgi:hypothetical protein
MTPNFMNLPTYLETENEQNYNAYLNQALRQGLSNNGWTVPQLTHQQLTAIPVINPGSGQESPSLASFMPDGTLWFIIDAVPPCYVGKINNALVKFTTTAYP